MIPEGTALDKPNHPNTKSRYQSVSVIGATLQPVGPKPIAHVLRPVSRALAASSPYGSQTFVHPADR